MPFGVDFVDVLSLGLQQLCVHRQVGEEIFRRHKIVALQDALEVDGKLISSHVDVDDMVGNGFTEVIGEDLIGKELGADSMQSLCRPLLEPVDGRVVDQSREVTATGAQCVTRRGHGKDNVQIVAAVSQEGVPLVLLVRGNLLSGELRYDAGVQGLLLFLSEEGGYHAGCKHVVDDFEEAFLLHVPVHEKEHSLFAFSATAPREQFL